MENRSSLLRRLLTNGQWRPLPEPPEGVRSSATAAAFDFDQLARDLAQGLSRREALRRLGLGAAAAVLGSLGLKPAAGQTTSPTTSCSEADLAACLHNRVQPCDAAVTRCQERAQQLFDQGMARCSTLPNPVQRAACVQRVTETRDRMLVDCTGLAAQCRQLEERCRDQFGCPGGQYCCNNQCSVCPCDRTLCPGSQRTDCCEAGAICLDGVCIRTQTDPFNCGGVGNACPANSTCLNGQCVCDPGYSPCSAVFGTGPMVCCHDATEGCRNGICLSGAEVCPAGTNFCGGAQRQDCCDESKPTCCAGICCVAGQYCCGSQCRTCPCDRTFCTGARGEDCCAAGETCCDGECVNAQSDPLNCGSCGRTCPSGAFCSSGQCVCGSSFLTCGAVCCDRSALACVNGRCTSCTSGQTPCFDRCCPEGTVCDDDSSSSTGVGTCRCDEDRGYFPCGGVCCPNFQGCLNGSCTTCPGGQKPCGDRCCPEGESTFCRLDFATGGGTCFCSDGYSLCGNGAPLVCCNETTEVCRNGICLTGVGRPSRGPGK